MTAGAGQRLAKVSGVLPGKRIVVAGSGAFLFAVAEALIGKGARIAALVEMRRPTVRLGLQMLRYPERWLEAWRLVRPVNREVGRIVYGKIVTEAHGRDHLEGLLIAAPDGSASEEIADVDALLISYGFQPSIEITSILGCSHRFDDALGGWFVDAEYATGLTSVAGVYAAGEVLGTAGARPATLSGTLAGLSSARGLGFAVDQLEISSILPRLRRARRFGHGLGRLYAPTPSIAKFARDDTVLCRCEEISLREIREACAEGARSAYGSKIWTRAGMGRCQGRICRMSITQAIARQTGRTIEEIGFNKPRVPVRPTPLDEVLAAFADANN
jgi:NADPH-dependent 2,4-dienoyl-CoA reductase/sulfur reductase-like enzyme